MIGGQFSPGGDIREICHGFAGADEGELQNQPLFHVGKVRFAIFNGYTSPPRPRWNFSGRSLHFVADPLERDALRQTVDSLRHLTTATAAGSP